MVLLVLIFETKRKDQYNIRYFVFNLESFGIKNRQLRIRGGHYKKRKLGSERRNHTFEEENEQSK